VRATAIAKGQDTRVCGRAAAEIWMWIPRARVVRASDRTRARRVAGIEWGDF